MGKTIERVESTLSISQIGSKLAEYNCGHIGKAKLEKTVGLPLPTIERRIESVNRARFLERR